MLGTTRRNLLVLMLLVLPSLVAAQATGTSTLQWDQTAPDAATAQAYAYKYYPDGATTGTALSGVTCSGTTTITCQVSYPAFTPGAHTLQLTASNVAGESPKSPVFNFTFVVVPTAPANLRIGHQ